MGYYINMHIQDVVIPADKQQACHAALVARMTEIKSKNKDATALPREYATLEKALDYEGFAIEKDTDTGDIELTEYMYEKSHDEDAIIEIIGRFAKPGGIINITGEDDCRWGFKMSGTEALSLYELAYMVPITPTRTAAGHNVNARSKLALIHNNSFEFLQLDKELLEAVIRLPEFQKRLTPDMQEQLNTLLVELAL